MKRKFLLFLGNFAKHFQTSYQCLYSSRFCDWESWVRDAIVSGIRSAFPSIIKSGSFINILHSYPSCSTKTEKHTGIWMKRRKKMRFRIFRKVLIFFPTDSFIPPPPPPSRIYRIRSERGDRVKILQKNGGNDINK